MLGMVFVFFCSIRKIAKKLRAGGQGAPDLSAHSPGSIVEFSGGTATEGYCVE